MSGLVSDFAQKWNHAVYELNDARTRDSWPHFGTLVTIMVVYLWFCKVSGPAWMKDRKPFELTRIIFFYNVFQVLISTYLFYKGFFEMWLPEYNWTCQPIDYSNNPKTLEAMNLVWIYTVLKLVELLDTVFFVLRKKDRQVSTLHLYHHTLMPICSWIGYKYYPNGHGTLMGLINCLVHTVMYTYYLIAGMGPQYQKYLWWKKHVTIMQLVQFGIIFIHNLIPLFNGCDYPKWINLALMICSLQFVYMFGSFYYVTYVKPKPIKSEKVN